MSGRGGCVPVRLKDGSTVFVNVKPGHTLTDADIEVLQEFYELLRKANVQCRLCKRYAVFGTEFCKEHTEP